MSFLAGQLLELLNQLLVLHASKFCPFQVLVRDIGLTLLDESLTSKKLELLRSHVMQLLLVSARLVQVVYSLERLRDPRLLKSVNSVLRQPTVNIGVRRCRHLSMGFLRL